MAQRLIVVSACLAVAAGSLIFGAPIEPASAQPAPATGCDPPAITSADSATATVPSVFSNIVIPFNFTITTCSNSVPLIKGTRLPPGLHLINNLSGTATISGVPSYKDAGSYTATITAAVKGEPVATQSLVITVDNAGGFSSKPQYTAKAGVPFSYLVATRSVYPIPTVTTSSPLPGGVTLVDNGNGTAGLEGTPAANAGGAYSVTIAATNSLAVLYQTFTLTVYQAPEFTSVANDTIAAGVAMTPFPVTVTGYPVPKLTASGLPTAVKLVDGSIEGTPRPTAADNYNATIRATGRAGTTTQAFTLAVT